MKTYIIDYLVNDRKDWKTVRAESLDAALKAFRTAGVDGWTGINFVDYEVIHVEERSLLE